MLLNELSIPGTHDTMTYGFAGTTDAAGTQTQTMSLSQQLGAGIRFLDIRCGPLYSSSGNLITGDLGLYHDIYGLQNETFNVTVVTACRLFLAQHPTETIVMSVKNEYPGHGDTSSLSSSQFTSTFDSIVGQDPSLWYLGSTVPSLDAARGKIVLVRRFGGSSEGINASGWNFNDPDFTKTISFPGGTDGSFRVQDQNAPGNLVATKETDVGNMLQAAIAQTGAPHGDDTWFVNFASAVEGLPITPSNWASYVNPWVNTQLAGIHSGRVGTVVFDFPENTQGLIDRVIGANWPFATLDKSTITFGGTATVTLHALEPNQTVTFGVDPNVADVGAVQEKTTVDSDGLIHSDYTATITPNSLGGTPILPQMDGAPVPTPYPVLTVQDHTQVTLTRSALRAVYGQPITLTATVRDVSVRGVVPTGQVQFKVDGKNVGGPVTLDASGKAVSAALATLNLGLHHVEATFSDTQKHFLGRHADGGGITVVPAATTVVLSSSADFPVYGQPVTLTAKVRVPGLAGDIPTGHVQFVVDGTNVGKPVLLDPSGSAHATLNNLSLGMHRIVVQYLNRDGDFKNSLGSFKQSVRPAETRISLQSSDLAPQIGASVTFTAHVTATVHGAGSPTGTVIFRAGSTTLGSATLQNGIAKLVTSALKVGQSSVVAIYLGDAHFKRSNSSATLETVSDPQGPPS
jgi:hypothetical protein